MRVAYKSDMGKKRKNNEDSILVDIGKGIFILADGMGGHQAGEIASDIGAKGAYIHLKDRIDQAISEINVPKLIVESLFMAHDAVREAAKENIGLLGMGTTIVVMVINDKQAYTCHVGDSRAYLLRDEITQITKDHTVGDYLIEHNIMKQEQIHPQKWHTLTQAIGVTDNIAPEFHQLEVEAGDYLLLCSDGLTDMLNDEEIFNTIKQHGEDIRGAADGLIEEANMKGGRDNISVVLTSI